MAQHLDTLDTSLEYRVLQKGLRRFALLGKATPFGILPFRPEDLGCSWAVTAEFGCIRLERLSGDEEVTGFKLLLPDSASYDYGITGTGETADLTRMIFGLLPWEMEELVTVLRRGSFPVLGHSFADLQCSISSCVIPACWPHVVVSNQPQYGNAVSLETFVRILVSSLPNGKIAVHLPNLQQVAGDLLKLMGTDRPGIPYHSELLNVAPAGVLTAK